MEGLEYISPSQSIFKRTGEPWIYLKVGNEWYCYDPASPTIGSGAMGTVWIGYRVSNGDKVAVKQVKNSYANQPQIRERAKQEASLAFRHPNLIEILGLCFWEADSGPIFILSNYVQGESITSFIKNFDGIPDREAKIINMCLPMMDAIDYIHSRGVVHRDIKPSNIMIENGQNIRLMDLGIARMNGGNAYSSYGFIGTPQYAAPEQILRGTNSASEINATSDVYAMGITMYELLDGSNPFDKESYESTLAAQMTQRLPKSPNISYEVMKVIHKATNKDQSERYQTIADFKQALSAALVPKSGSDKFITWVKDNIWLVVGLISAFMLLVIGVILAIVL